MRLLFITFSLFFTLISAQAAEKPLKIGISQEFETLNPLIKQMMATTYIYGFVNRNLVTMNEKGEYIPMIAESIPDFENGQAKFITENGTKKIKANWKIKEEAKWGDGTPVTAYDVKLAWSTALLDTVSVGEKKTYSQVERIEIDPKNPKHFSFVYEEAMWNYYQLGSFYLLPAHLEKKVVKEHGEKVEGYAKNTLYTKDPTNPGLYNGPYLIDELKLGSHLILKPNPHFYGEKPNIKTIIIKLIQNTGTLEANLRSGSIDMVSVLGMSFDQALSFEKKVNLMNLPFNVNYKPSLVYEHIDLNMENELLQDIKVRRALVHAIDRKKLTLALFEGKQQMAYHNVAPLDPWYTDDPKKIRHYKPSKRKARKLLEKAGWKLKDDGFRYKDGKRLEFTIMTTAGNKTRELIQAFIQNEWKSVGIKLNIKNEPARVFFSQTVLKGEYPHMALFAWISAPESVPRSSLHSSSIPTESNAFSGQNTGKWNNKQVDKIIDELEFEFDSEERKNMVAKLLKIYTDEVPVIPLYYRSDVSITPEGLKNYVLTGHQYPNSNFAEQWTWETK
ncbi:MAG: peptide ABC transporter substrate-binding protein [Bdellovibrionales bacterium]|nr:peptide ABC transporter substrate-binding protein [Bdellovibrionales bacterium]